MLMNVILHPSVIASAQALFRNFAELSCTSQVILCTLVQVRAAARRDTPLPENLAEIAHIIGSVPTCYDRAELDDAKYEVYDTLQRMAARDRAAAGEVYTYEAWHRDIS